MKYLLGLLALIMGFYTAAFAVELMTVDARADATVHQQISARLSVGLSMVAFILAAGLSALCHGIEGLRNDLAKSSFLPTSPAQQVEPATPSIRMADEGAFTGKTSAELKRERDQAVEQEKRNSSGAVAAADINAPGSSRTGQGGWVNRS